MLEIYKGRRAVNRLQYAIGKFNADRKGVRERRAKRAWGRIKGTKTDDIRTKFLGKGSKILLYLCNR